MAETVSYWICACNKANLKSEKRCSECGKRRRIGWTFYASLCFVAVLIFILVWPDDNQNGRDQFDFTDEQDKFIQILDRTKQDFVSSANYLAKHQQLKSRETTLAQHIQVNKWYGKVLGIQEMQGKAAVSIDAGGFEVVAGVQLMLGLDTLIPTSQSDLYNVLLNLEINDQVIFSGLFVSNDGSVVELSYSDESSIENPRFLFMFSDIVPAQ